MITISAGGDFCLANDPTTVRFGLVSQIDKPYKTKLIQKLKGLFQNSDLTIINLESPIADSLEKAINHSFLMPPDVVDILLKANINIVNVANNHILEHGTNLFDNTITMLKNAGIQIIGKYENNFKDTIQEIKIKDIRIGIAGFNERHDHLNNFRYTELNLENVFSTLKVMNNEDYDIKVLVFHWGNEYINFPSSKQIEYAHQFIDNGANIIFGHHSHVIQPVEKYNGGLIAYSLGNLFFDNLFSRNVRNGIVIHSYLNRTELNYDIRPIWLDNNLVFNTAKNKKVLKKYFKIQNEFQLRKNIAGERYERIYERELNFKRLFQRLLMKKEIIKIFISKELKVKVQLIRNISQILKRKLPYGST